MALIISWLLKWHSAVLLWLEGLATADPATRLLLEVHTHRSHPRLAEPEAASVDQQRLEFKSYWVALKHADLWGMLAQTDKSKDEMEDYSPSWAKISQCFNGIFSAWILVI